MNIGSMVKRLREYAGSPLTAGYEAANTSLFADAAHELEVLSNSAISSPKPRTQRRSSERSEPKSQSPVYDRNGRQILVGMMVRHCDDAGFDTPFKLGIPARVVAISGRTVIVDLPYITMRCPGGRAP